MGDRLMLRLRRLAHTCPRVRGFDGRADIVGIGRVVRNARGSRKVMGGWTFDYGRKAVPVGVWDHAGARVAGWPVDDLELVARLFGTYSEEGQP